MDAEIFKAVKQAYVAAREKERMKIIDYLAEQEGFTKIKHKGMGIPNYGKSKKGENRLEPPYDLSNWKYVVTRYNGKNIFISLQSFDIDPSSKNLHVLMDRIGIFVYKDDSNKPECKPVDIYFNGKKVKVADPFLRMETTGLELPLSDGDLKKLVKIIKKKVEG